MNWEFERFLPYQYLKFQYARYSNLAQFAIEVEIFLLGDARVTHMLYFQRVLRDRRVLYLA